MSLANELLEIVEGYDDPDDMEDFSEDDDDSDYTNEELDFASPAQELTWFFEDLLSDLGVLGVNVSEHGDDVYIDAFFPGSQNVSMRLTYDDREKPIMEVLQGEFYESIILPYRCISEEYGVDVDEFPADTIYECVSDLIDTSISEEVYRVDYEGDESDDIDEARIKGKHAVIRKGVKKIVVSCLKGWKKEGGKCIRMSSGEKKRRAKGAKVGSKKGKSKRIKSRKVSMKKRAQMEIDK